VAEERTATIVGEVDIEGGEAFTERKTFSIRNVDERSVTFDVEYDSEDSFVTYIPTAWIE
jgi:hypothetical protein